MPGERLEFIAQLGQGGAGTTLQGLFDGVSVAVKLYGQTRKDLGRAAHEVLMYKKMKPLQGVYIPRLVACGQVRVAQQPVIPRLPSYLVGMCYFIAMELVPCQAIALPCPERAWAAANEALKAIHASGVLHNDLKLDNILLCNGGVRFIDFDKSNTASGKGAEDECERLKHVLGR